MKNFLKKNWVLIAIILFAAALRLIGLSKVPPSLTQDEAALGYNAYSILKTGKDEYGKTLPMIFKSFGDYKPGLYIYLDVPFVSAFGLNEFSTRLPSALAGIIAVYLIYLIAKKLFPDNKNLPLISTFVMAITPWSIYLSRGAWEVNVALTLTLAGIYFFLKSFEKSKYLFLSAVFFALTLITYQGAKLSSAIVIVILIAVYWQELFKISKKYIFGSIALGVIISLPIVLSLFTGQTGRLDVFSIFSYPRPKDYTQAFLNEGGEKFGSLSYYLFHSETLNFARGILGRYFNHFSGKFLFFEGDYQNPQHSAPYQGMLLVTDIILILIGIAAFYRQKLSKSFWFILLWLIFSPLPAVLTRDQVQSVRALNMVVPLAFILAWGLNEVLICINSRKNKIIYLVLLTGFYLVGFVYFADAYYIHVPKHNSSYWNYGYKQVVEKVSSLQLGYTHIIVEQSFSQPYIYFLYFQKYDPAKYQKQANLVASSNASDVGLVTKIDNVLFQNIDWSYISNLHGALVVVGFQNPIPADLKYDLVDQIYYLNGRDLAFNIIKIK